MPLQLQITLFVVSFIVFLMILKYIKKAKLSTEMATVWILWSIGLVVISIFPELIYRAGSLIGIISPFNTVYLVMIFLLYILVFYLYLKVSILEEKTKNLVHVIALIEKEKKDGKDHRED